MPCTQELFYTLFAIGVCTFFLFSNIWKIVLRRWQKKRSLPNSKVPLSAVSLSGIHSLLNPPGATKPRLLSERSRANVRLVNALGLTNTFVSSDPIVHNTFVQYSLKLLKGVQANGWTRFQEICRQAVRLTLEEWHSTLGETPHSGIQFDKFVQVVVLRLVLVGLLDVGKDVEELDLSSSMLVTDLINNLWTQSKSGLHTPNNDHLRRQLHQHLRFLVPDSARFDNPIDFVVPTWETMWRVCATTIARVQESDDYKNVFHDFLGSNAPIGFTARDFVDEVMRLHPPIKHISRVPSLSPQSSAITTTPSSFEILRRIRTTIQNLLFQPQLEAACQTADIETILRVPTIWKEDANMFKPERHRALTPDMKRAHKLIFGLGPLRCVAASWAPDAAAVISATIMEESERMGWSILRGAKVGGRTGWEGWKLNKTVQ